MVNDCKLESEPQNPASLRKSDPIYVEKSYFSILLRLDTFYCCVSPAHLAGPVMYQHVLFVYRRPELPHTKEHHRRSVKVRGEVDDDVLQAPSPMTPAVPTAVDISLAYL